MFSDGACAEEGDQEHGNDDAAGVAACGASTAGMRPTTRHCMQCSTNTKVCLQRSVKKGSVQKLS